MSAYERVRNSWGDCPPSFILALANEVDRTSQSAAARRIGISPTAVNLLLGNKYGAKTRRLEEKIRLELFSETVDCPYLGQIITRKRCAAHKKSPISAANPRIFQHKRACLTCIYGEEHLSSNSETIG